MEKKCLLDLLVLNGIHFTLADEDKFIVAHLLSYRRN